MKTIAELRYENALRLISEDKSIDGITDFATKLGKAQSYVSNILGTNPGRNIGNKVARQIEDYFGVQEGWLDANHSFNNVSPAPNLSQQVPLLGKVSAGAFIHTRELEPHEVETWLMSPKDYKGLAFGLRVEGDSMTSAIGKSYPEGSIAVFNSGNKTPNNGQLVLAKVSGADEVTFKKYVYDAGNHYLMPLNPNYPRIDKKFKVLAVFEYAIVY
ncbi:MAG: LexA family transcriptional repressor [Gammaproteobacteria bacterium]|nr:LexA family transcriptional repressor [Gammaproteobacteria bacterium]